MRYAWRWFGTTDSVSLNDIRQAGADEIVCALYDVPIGDVWQEADIVSLKSVIETGNATTSPLRWTIVESIPLHDDIKRGVSGWQLYADNFILSCRNLAKQGIHVVAYNFMPLLDWTRTDLSWPLPNGGKTLRFDYISYVAFDVYVLQRPNAKQDYSESILAEATACYQSLSTHAIAQLTRNILAGLPGGMTGEHTLESFSAALVDYQDISPEVYRKNLIQFLTYVTPALEAIGMTLALHPDDPPFSLFGLPRVVSTATDLDDIFAHVPSIANQLTFCTGSLGVRDDNDLPQMVQKYANRIAFAHLRGTVRDKAQPLSFQEADHLFNDADMVAVIRNLLAAEKEQRSGVLGKTSIPFRPDHGFQILDDIDKTVNPGYSAIGRLKGMAEIRGVITALSA